jgi:hypothetical protein
MQDKVQESTAAMGSSIFNYRMVVHRESTVVSLPYYESEFR